MSFIQEGKTDDLSLSFLHSLSNLHPVDVNLYEAFLKDYVFQYEGDRKRIAESLKRFFGKSKIKIVAIDGKMRGV